MTIIRSIQCGDLEGFISKKDEILEEVNMMLDTDHSTLEWENYVTYWIAMYEDCKVATEMFKVFLETCKTTFRPDEYEEVMSIYAYPTMVGAVATNNSEILELLKGYVSESDIQNEMIL